MNISQSRSQTILLLAIAAAVLAMIPLQFFRVPIGDEGPLDVGEQGGYLALGMLSFITATAMHSRANRSRVLWIVIGLAFVVLLVADLTGTETVWQAYTFIDIPAVGVWLATSLVLVFGLCHADATRHARAFLLVGFGLQTLALAASFSESLLLSMPPTLEALVRSAEEVCDVSSLGAYLAGLLLISPALVPSTSEAETKSASAGERLFDWLTTGPYRHAVIAFEEAKRVVWQLRYPGTEFAAYYAGDIVARLNRGRSHRTLGRRPWSKSFFARTEKNWSDGACRERGLKRFQELKSFGITSASTVVEFGCGSLRIGQHFIHYLDAGRFWGLDITDRFYSEGVKLVGADVIGVKRPHLHVIAEEALLAVRQAEPDLIYSIAVMKHVPANELETYWRRLQSMMAPRTTVMVEFQLAARNMRIGGKSWAYNEDFVRSVIDRVMPQVRVRLESMDRKGKRTGNWTRVRLIVLDLHRAFPTETEPSADN